VFQGACDEPRRETVEVSPTRATQAQVHPRLARVVDSGVPAIPIVVEATRLRVDLLGDVLERRGVGMVRRSSGRTRGNARRTSAGRSRRGWAR
jgi:hypothetical protein